MTTSMVVDFGVQDALHDGNGTSPLPFRDAVAGRPARGAAPVPRAARELVADAGRVLGRAMGEADPRERFAQAHLAALRGAAAVLAARARPRRLAHGNAWELLARITPELAEWSAFFAAGSRRRQAIVAGVSVVVPPREADDMVRAAAEFLDHVGAALSQARPGAAGR
jgi:hypothetical protein